MCLLWPYHSNGSAVLLCKGVAKEMLLHSNGDLQDSTVELVIDVRNMWEVSMKGSHMCFLFSKITDNDQSYSVSNIGICSHSWYDHRSKLILTHNCTVAEMAVIAVKPVDKSWDMEQSLKSNKSTT
jgi:hypothetical protein